MIDALIAIDVKATLAASWRSTAVPRHAQRLQFAVGQLDEVLLQRVDPERVSHREFGRPAVGAGRIHDVLITTPTENRSRIVMYKFRIGEITEHRYVFCDLHREVVMGTGPELRLFGMAPGACLGSDIHRLAREIFAQGNGGVLIGATAG